MTISATTQGLRPGVCTSTSRPSVPFDGMLIYETDTNRVAVYDTNAWVYKTPDTTAGSVLQVVSTTKTDTFTATFTNTFADVTGLSVTITPLYATSKVLVIASINFRVNESFGVFRFMRGTTAISIGDAASSRGRATQVFGSNLQLTTYNSHFLDSPATTSATTYKVQLASSNTGAGSTIWVNRNDTDTDSAAFWRGTSTITVMEIAQ